MSVCLLKVSKGERFKERDLRREISGERAQERELRRESSGERAQGRELRRESSEKSAQERELSRLSHFPNFRNWGRFLRILAFQVGEEKNIALPEVLKNGF